VIGKETEIAALVRAALDSDVVRDAVAHGFRREMYVAAPIGTHLLEGYIDLTYRNHQRTGVAPCGTTTSSDASLMLESGLVVVDYKTDAWRDEADLDDRCSATGCKARRYAVALEAATGEPWSRACSASSRRIGR